VASTTATIGRGPEARAPRRSRQLGGIGNGYVMFVSVTPRLHRPVIEDDPNPGTLQDPLDLQCCLPELV